MVALVAEAVGLIVWPPGEVFDAKVVRTVGLVTVFPGLSVSLVVGSVDLVVRSVVDVMVDEPRVFCWLVLYTVGCLVFCVGWLVLYTVCWLVFNVGCWLAYCVVGWLLNCVGWFIGGSVLNPVVGNFVVGWL